VQIQAGARFKRHVGPFLMVPLSGDPCPQANTISMLSLLITPADGHGSRLVGRRESSTVREMGERGDLGSEISHGSGAWCTKGAARRMTRVGDNIVYDVHPCE